MDGEGKREEEGRGGELEREYGKKERHQFAMPTETTKSAVVWKSVIVVEMSQIVSSGCSIFHVDSIMYGLHITNHRIQVTGIYHKQTGHL